MRWKECLRDVSIPGVQNYGREYLQLVANASEALGTWQNFQQKELQKDLLMAYGFGGGGPTREMLENIEVMKKFPALPQVRQFFESIEPLTESKMKPIWNGELYLEYHHLTGKILGKETELVGVPFEDLKRLNVPDFSICEEIFAYHVYYSSEKLFRDVTDFHPQVSLEQGMPIYLKPWNVKDEFQIRMN